MTSDLENSVKRCPKCGETKPLTDFIGPRAAKPRVYCNPCNSQYVQEWNAAHPERAREIRTDYIRSGRYREVPSYKRSLERGRVKRAERGKTAENRVKLNHERAMERLAHEIEHGRVCKVCGQTKPRDEFASCGKPRHPEYPNEHQKRPQCKECWSKIVWTKEKEERGDPSTPRT